MTEKGVFRIIFNASTSQNLEQEGKAEKEKERATSVKQLHGSRNGSSFPSLIYLYPLCERRHA